MACRFETKARYYLNDNRILHLDIHPRFTRFPFKEFPFSLVRFPDSADVDETTPDLTS
jgi:hypothetical protein